MIETTFLVSRPLRSTPTPASRDFAASTGRSASERRIGTQCLRFLPRHAPSSDLWGLRPRSPYRRSPSHVPCKSRRPGSRRLYAGHRLAGNAGTRQAHLEGRSRTPDFDAISDFRRLNDDAPPGLPGRALLERLPGPHLTGSSPAFSLDAHHDSRQLTQLQGGLTPTPAGPTPESQQSPISRIAPHFRKPLLHQPPSAFVTHRSPGSQHEEIACMRGFSDPAGSADGSRKRLQQCCLPCFPTTSAPQTSPISRLNSRPACTPIQRFAAPSRVANAWSGPSWRATPST